MRHLHIKKVYDNINPSQTSAGRFVFPVQTAVNLERPDVCDKRQETRLAAFCVEVTMPRKSRMMQRNAQMREMRLKEGKTLTEIASIFGITKQAVSKAIGYTGADFRVRWTEEQTKALPLPESEGGFVGIKKVWMKIWTKSHHKVNGPLAKYQEWEHLASRIMTENGINHEPMPVKHPFDILLDNGKRVDVKFAGPCKPPTSKFHNGYRASRTKHGKDCDFFFVFIDKDTYFVIPSECAAGHIIIPWPKSNKPSKFHQYFRRLDLLKGG